MRFEGKNALVTGAAGGIGKAIVKALRREGARVAVTDRNTNGIEADYHLDGDLTDATEGIRCNAVAPGRIDTPLNEDFIESLVDPTEFRKKIGVVHPDGRTGRAEEVAQLICFLASEDASFIARQVLTIDGGRMTRLSLP